MKPIGHSGPSVPIMPPPDKQPESKSAEQTAAAPGKEDKKELPDHEVRPGQANLQRFLAVHGKASGGAEIQPEADADDSDAGVRQDAQSHSADPHGAGSSNLRRRATGAQGERPAEQTQGAPGAPLRRNGNARAEPSLANSAWTVLKVMTGLLAMSTGFRLMRNPGDFVSNPGSALAGAMNFNERLDEQVLSKANQAVLDKFGTYIPKDSRCNQVRAELSFEMSSSNAAAFFNERRNYIAVRPYQLPGTGLAHAAHEYCHCYSHPMYRRAVEETPNRLHIDESLTEHVKDKIPRDGRLAKLMAPLDSGYHGMKMSNGKNLQNAAHELEAKVGEATLLRAYFSGDKDAIRKVSRAAVDIYPKRVTTSAWKAIGKTAGNADNIQRQQLGECFVGASLLLEGKLPALTDRYSYSNQHLPIYDFSQISDTQQKALKNQAMQARERLGEKFDHAFFNFDENAAKAAMKAVRNDLQANWKCVLPEQKSYF